MQWPRTPPTLSDGVVILRAWEDDDLDAVVEIASDPGTQAFTNVPATYQRSDGVSFLRSAMDSCWPEMRFAVTDDRDAVIGTCVLRDEGEEVVSFGYSVHPGVRGQGIATRTGLLLIDLAFRIGAQRVWLTAYTTNSASIRVAEKCGLRREGVLRGAHLGKDGARHDLVLFAVLRSDVVDR